ncbi:MAG: hypothetical protein M1284_02245 [Candidatus Parvarchaeota archaeon]|nr:hypothetical protein [Candidatus Parvarchaeota archaeon]MCL5420554.1 hypothetical protein [Candidatus Parvarchaeota archaeon]
MLTRKAQIVIGIGIIILSAAFLLVGVYFANLQGLFFQNGARSLQLFADNIGFSINSLYSAPSSMSITLAGNNSLCSWNPSISAYTCAGGSKVYNLSYANGPTLDAGKNVFSVALCFMIGYGFGGVGGSTSGAKEGVDAATQVSTEVAKDTENTLVQTGEQAAHELPATAIEDTGQSAGESPSLLSRLGTRIKNGLITNIKHPFIQDLPEDSLLSSSMSTIREALRTSSAFIPVAVASMSAALVAVPIFELWFGTSSSTLNTYVTKGIYINGQQIGALTGPSVSISQQIAAAYLNQEPLPFKYAAADFVLQQYSQLLSSEQTLNSLPPGLGKDTLLLFTAKQIAVKQNVLSELSAGASASTNPYSTPTSGVSSPGVLSSPNSLVGSVHLSANGADPLLSIPFFLAQNAFLVYARTASCLSIPSQPLNVNSYNSVGKGVSSLTSEFGAATTLVNIYTKINSILPLGTYFVGYGGEVYLNGQSSGRPTQVTAPLITDMNDMCELAQTTSEPGQNLRTIIQPSGNGSITFSLSQGLYNTLCSSNNALFPHTLQTELNGLLNANASDKNMTVLLPPGDSLAISNTGKNIDLCIYSILIDSFGSPVISAGNFNSASFNATEFGSPVSCVNLTNLSGGAVNIGISSGELTALNNDMQNNRDFYINNGSLLGFSVPITDFPNQITATSLLGTNSFLSAGNFIAGGQPAIRKDLGINFPVASLIASIIGKKIPKLQAGISTSLDNFLITPLYQLSSSNTNLSYYQTDYANVTIEFGRTTAGGVTTYNINKVFDNLVFGVYPNNLNSFGGTYFSGS